MLALVASSAFLSCQKPTPEPEPEKVLTVKTGGAEIDENDVVISGSYTYDGTDAVTTGFRYAQSKDALATAELIKAIATDGNFSTELKALANGEYYYQAVASTADKEIAGAEGYFKIDFSLEPTLTTEVADIKDEGFELHGTYAFASKKVAIKIGFFYAATEAELANAALAEVTPGEGNTLSLTVPFSIGANCYYQVGAIVEGQTYRGEVKSAGLGNLSADGTANCYIVRDAGWYSFKACKPDGTAVTGDKADWLWATGTETGLVSNVTYAAGSINFKVEKYQPASVIIALYNGSAIVWTWHIWMSDSKDQPLNGITFMDRNLGAINVSANDPGSIGLMFQFGRKDPFIGTNVMDKSIATNLYETTAFSLDRTLARPWCADYVVNSNAGITFSHLTEDMDEAKAVANPMTHYGKWNAGGYNMGNDAVKDFWGGVSKSKQNQDPCPAGYKVPSYDDIYNYVNGVLLNSSSGATSVYGKTSDGKETWGRVYTLNGEEYNWPATGWRAWSGVIARPGNVIAMTTCDVTTTANSMTIYWNWGKGGNYFCEAFPLRCVKM